MIYVLYGDDIVSSRNYLLSLKEENKDKELISLDIAQISPTDIVQTLTSLSLLQNQRLIIVENLFSIKNKKTIDLVINIIKNNKQTCDIIFWESKALGQRSRTFKALQNTTLKEFKLSKIIFSFVDSLTPNNSSLSLSLFQKTLSTTVPEIIFSMILRQFRILLGLKLDANISEISKLQSWQKGKFSRQLNAFTLRGLQSTYKKLFAIDYTVKTGQTPHSLTTEIERFIIGL